MSAILWDFIKRWKWLAVGIAVIQILTMQLLFHDNPPFIIRMYCLFGFLALGFDASSTIPRILLSFPVSRRQMALLMWSLAVPIPVAFITFCSVVGVAIFQPLGVVMENPVEVILWLSIGGFGLAGSWWYGFYFHFLPLRLLSSAVHASIAPSALSRRRLRLPDREA